MSPHKIDSLADDVKALVPELLQQNSGLMACIDELVAQNKALPGPHRRACTDELD